MALPNSRLISVHSKIFKNSSQSILKSFALPLSFSKKRTITVVPLSEQEANQKRKNQKLPISPHVTIYKFPLPALTSITHRFTGIGLTAGLYGAGVLCAVGPTEKLTAVLEALKAVPELLPLVKFTVAFPFTYHTVSGIRHITWDKTAKGIDTESMYTSSYVVLGVSVVASLGLAFYSI